MVRIASCSKGLDVYMFNGPCIHITDSSNALEAKHYGTVDQAKKNVCDRVCSTIEREECKILDNL